jgi:acyl-CoA thioesterase-2
VDRIGVTLHEELGLRATADPSRWQFELTPRVLTPAGALHGGAALAAAVEALEVTIGRPLVWATAQYLTHAGPTGRLTVEVTVEVDGKQTTQARARLVYDDSEILLAVASLGTRDFPATGRWVDPPDVARPHDAMARPPSPPGVESLLDHYDIRIATGRARDELDGSPGSGRSAIWCRLPGGRRLVGAGDIALIGDLLMLGLSDAVGRPSTANSLDHTIRVVERAATEWVLVDVNVDAVVGGYAHAGARLWSDDGVLLGTATQSLVLRSADHDGQSSRSTRRIIGDDAALP